MPCWWLTGRVLPAPGRWILYTHFLCYPSVIHLPQTFSPSLALSCYSVSQQHYLAFTDACFSLGQTRYVTDWLLAQEHWGPLPIHSKFAGLGTKVYHVKTTHWHTHRKHTNTLIAWDITVFFRNNLDNIFDCLIVLCCWAGVGQESRKQSAAVLQHDLQGGI